MPDAVPPWRREKTLAVPAGYILRLFSMSLRTPAPRATLFVGHPDVRREPAVIEVPQGRVWPEPELMRQLEDVMRTHRRAVSFEYPNYREALQAFASLMRARE
jgi:hypothetical protein